MHQKLLNNQRRISVDLLSKDFRSHNVLDSGSKNVPRRNEKFLQYPEF